MALQLPAKQPCAAAGPGSSVHSTRSVPSSQLPGAAHFPCRDLLTGVSEVLLTGMPLFGNQELAITLWSLVKLHHYPGKGVLQAAEAVMLRRLRATLQVRMLCTCCPA